MKRKILIFLIVVISIFALTYFYVTKPPQIKCLTGKDASKSKLEKFTPLKVVYLYGSGYERGVQHGKLLKKDIRYIVSVLKGIVGNFAYYIAITEAKKLDKNIPLKYRCEMKGVADGAGVSYYDILLINTFDDLKHLIGCSSLIVIKGKKSKEYIFARNLDYPHKELAKENVIFVYKNEKNHSYISLSFPGYIGVLTGFNDAGISLSIHTSATKENSWGLPTGILLRECMEEASSIKDVFKIISGARRCQGNNLMVGSFKENMAAVMEYTAKRIGIRYVSPDKGFIDCTNHFQIDGMKKYNKSVWKNSLKRASFIEEKLNKDIISLDDVISIFSYYDGNVSWTSVANRGTVQSVIFVPERDLMLVGKGTTPPVNGKGFREFKISDFIQLK